MRSVKLSQKQLRTLVEHVATQDQRLNEAIDYQRVKQALMKFLVPIAKRVGKELVKNVLEEIIKTLLSENETNARSA